MARNLTMRMKRILTICSLLLCLSIDVVGREYTVQNLPNIHLQDKTKFTTNPDHILSEATCDTIDKYLYALEQQTGIEAVVVAVSSIGETSCFDFSHQLLNHWGVGKKGKDNGLVILLVTDQRCVHFYTGYGLEGILTDALSKRIQVKHMIPFLQQQDWNNGMVQGVLATYKLLEGSMENDTQATNEDLQALLMPLLFILLALAFFFYRVWQQSRCPQCHKHQLQRSGSKLVSLHQGIRQDEVTYTCQHCGHTISFIQQSYQQSFPGRGMGRGPFGGPFGGFPGGGGFSGGSGSGGGFFGGGSGGGGGAGSRF